MNETFNSLNNNEILISLSTSPKRINNIGPLLETLSNQTIKPNKIILNLPYLFKRTNSTFNTIPDFITNNNLIYINWCNDIGPATKIIPTVKLAKSPNSILISVDDDIEYKNTMVEILLNYSNKYPDAVITGESFMRLSNDKKIITAELVEGYSSVLYKKKHLVDLSEEIIKNYPIYCKLADDYIISNYLRKKNILIIVVNTEKPYDNIYVSYGNNEDALRNGADKISNGNIDNYIKCSNYLKSINDLYIIYNLKNI